jgi:hypothetical protein
MGVGSDAEDDDDSQWSDPRDPKTKTKQKQTKMRLKIFKEEEKHKPKNNTRRFLSHFSFRTLFSRSSWSSFGHSHQKKQSRVFILQNKKPDKPKNDDDVLVLKNNNTPTARHAQVPPPI